MPIEGAIHLQSHSIPLTRVLLAYPYPTTACFQWVLLRTTHTLAYTNTVDAG